MEDSTDPIRLLQLPDLVREQFVLELPSIADIIVLENTNRDLRQWIEERRIYKKWERKHFGKTDKWRILLLQVLAVQQSRRIFFIFKELTRIRVTVLYSTFVFDWESVNYQNPEHHEILVKAVRRFASYSGREFDGDILQDPSEHVNWHDVIELAEGIAPKMYYYMYDLLRMGFMYMDEYDIDGFENETPRLIREGVKTQPLCDCVLTHQFTHMCQRCKAQFCGETCKLWPIHRCSQK